MISKEQNKFLVFVGNAALIKPDWKEYADYCFNREKGLRRAAIRHLDNFLDIANRWTIDQKIEFVTFLYTHFEQVQNADYAALPQPLSRKLVEPTLAS